MGNVRLLPDEIVSKIAAGEVVERPASVVKELMENALDAGAQAIEVHLQGAGKTSIQVKDNGHGIEPDDIEHIFQRHTTSKISRIDDLYAIGSLGFRGEALYSIASVSDIILRSKISTAPTGWEIHLRGGKRLNLKPVPCPTGTAIEIKELFFNTPARRKFLKTDSAELTQILNVFIPYTLSQAQGRFLIAHSGKTLLDLCPAQTLLERISQCLHLKRDDLIQVNRDYPVEKLTLRLVLGNINIQRARKDMQFVFVNNRPVQNRSIGFHLNQIYRLIFPPEVFAFFAVFLTLPAGHVDVNVHPTKREVKIKDENAIALLIRSVVEETLMRTGSAKRAEDKVFSYLETTSAPDSLTIHDGQEKSTPLVTPFEPGLTQVKPSASEPNRLVMPEDLFAQSQESLREKLSQARFLGVFIRKYLLFESGHSIFAVDQHAAQERINFEKLRRQIKTNQVEVQNLLSPILIKLSLPEIISWQESKERLEEMKIDATLWDKETLAVHAYPQLLDHPELTIREILSQGNPSRFHYDSLATRACRQSVMTGDKMSPPEAEHQLKELTLCADPFTCPHGRPTVIEVQEKFLDKQFLRI